MPRNAKGRVGIETVKGMLRLRLPRHLFGGEQRYLCLGLPDNDINRNAAQQKAAAIEHDIAFDKLDPTLSKYQAQILPSEPLLDLVDLWSKYTDYKTKTLTATTIKKDYQKVKNHIARLGKPMKARQVRKHLIDTLTVGAAKKVLMFINACCDWALAEELIEVNPYASLPAIKTRKVSNLINPFTRAEQAMIIEAFQKSDRHKTYANLVKFLFWTGCRPSEAVALQWKDIDPDLKLFLKILLV